MRDINCISIFLVLDTGLVPISRNRSLFAVENNRDFFQGSAARLGEPEIYDGDFASDPDIVVDVVFPADVLETDGLSPDMINLVCCRMRVGIFDCFLAYIDV